MYLSLTVTFSVAVAVSKSPVAFTVIVALPLATAFTTPVSSTVATAVFDDSYDNVPLLEAGVIVYSPPTISSTEDVLSLTAGVTTE